MNNSASLPGKVYLIGAGPGAQDLITLLGARLLAQADVVLHDALVTSEMLELCPQAQKILVGKRCGQLSTAQAFINKQLVDNARKHAVVVRLKGGDPMLFGRADEAGAGRSGHRCRSSARYYHGPGGRRRHLATADQAGRLAQRGLLYLQHGAGRT